MLPLFAYLQSASLTKTCFHASGLSWMDSFVSFEVCIQHCKQNMFSWMWIIDSIVVFKWRLHRYQNMFSCKWVVMNGFCCVFWSLYSALQAKYAFMNVNNRSNWCLWMASASLSKHAFMHANNRWKDCFGAFGFVRRTCGVEYVQSCSSPLHPSLWWANWPPAAWIWDPIPIILTKYMWSISEVKLGRASLTIRLEKISKNYV